MFQVSKKSSGMHNSFGRLCSNFKWSYSCYMSNATFLESPLWNPARYKRTVENYPLGVKEQLKNNSNNSYYEYVLQIIKKLIS